MLRGKFGDSITYNCANIRPEWAHVRGDDQNKSRSMTLTQAHEAGTTRFVIGRPITQARKPYDAALRTLEEINNMN